MLHLKSNVFSRPVLYLKLGPVERLRTLTSSGVQSQSSAAGTPGRNPGGSLQVAGLSSVLTEPGHRGGRS